MRRTALAAAALTLVLAACGSNTSTGASSDASTGDAATTTVMAQPGTSFNDADVLFAQSMIPHHEQAVEMAEMALDAKAAAGTEVKALAARVKAAQDPEIAQMKAWLTANKKPVQMDTSGGHDMSSMDGMMSAGDMDALAKKTGKDFDKAWLDMMIAHHKGAITMAETEKAKGADPELKALADAIITAQQKEIAEMTALGGSGS